MASEAPDQGLDVLAALFTSHWFAKHGRMPAGWDTLSEGIPDWASPEWAEFRTSMDAWAMCFDVAIHLFQRAEEEEAP